MSRYENDISIVFGGSAGQGVQTIADALVTVLKKNGYSVFACTEFMSRIRGGSNSTQVRITEKKRSAYVRRIDFLFALNAEAIEHLRDRRGRKKRQASSTHPLRHLQNRPEIRFFQTPWRWVLYSDFSTFLSMLFPGI